MLQYKAIEIFTSEEARHKRKPLVDAVLQYVRDLRIAARCIVTRGIAGCYESGEITTSRLEVLSYNMPLRIYILAPAAQTQQVLQGLEPMVSDGIIVLHDLRVLNYRARNAFFPRHLMVRDVMTANPQSVSVSDPLDAVARLLLSSIFSGLPVVDETGRPVGLITQGDLISKGGLPLRIGLMAEADHQQRAELLNVLSLRTAAEVMTTPVLLIAEDRPVSEAVETMLARSIKRLPVVDRSGRLTGMLSRLDIFKTVMREAPDWDTFRSQQVEINHLKHVRDIVRRDTVTVSPETPVQEVIQRIDRSDIQRVAVVDDAGRLMGVISDRDLLRYFKQSHKGIWRLFFKRKQPDDLDLGECGGDLQACLGSTRADEVMVTVPITIKESAPIEEAVALMTAKGLKRLPVVDPSGRFMGMISRDSLLRAGFGYLQER